MKREMANHQPPEPRDENPHRSSMNQIHLLPAGDPNNPVPPYNEEIMCARIFKKFKLLIIKAYDGTVTPLTTFECL